MTNQPPTLREIAQAILDKHQVSGRALNRLADSKGLTLSYTTVNEMAGGRYTSRPSDKTLQALQALSDVSLEDVYAAARRPMPRAGLRERLPEDASALTGEQEEAVLAVVRQFVQANQRLYDSTNPREDVRNQGSSAVTRQAPASGADVQMGHHTSSAVPNGASDSANVTQFPSAEALDPTLPDDVAARSETGKGKTQKARERQDKESEGP